MHDSTGKGWKRNATGVTAPVPDPTNLLVGRERRCYTGQGHWPAGTGRHL